jgi:acyl-coenzyme A synthetase/AMP-(fatty) acid ligase
MQYLKVIGSVGEPIEAWHWFNDQYWAAKEMPSVDTWQAETGNHDFALYALSHHKSLPTLCTGIQLF